MAEERYQVHFYYTHIKPVQTQQVKCFIVTYDTLKEALKRARKPADTKKGIYTTTVIDTQTGETLYQKIEMFRNGMGLMCEV